jgi:hypothetical protein
MNISVKVTCQSNGWNKQNKHIDYSISNIFFFLFFILLLDTSYFYRHFLFCSQPIKEKRIFIEYKSNTHNNILWFRGYVFSDREKTILKTSRF